jgi:hypothetical protein
MSHHYSGPQFGFPNGDARLDFCDLYAFRKSGDSTKSILIMNFHPSSTLTVDISPTAPALEVTNGVPFSSHALYELRIDTNGDNVADVTYQVAFTKFADGAQTATLRLIKGVKTTDGGGDVLIQGAAVSLDAEAKISEGASHRFFAGWRSDPFFFDPPGAFNGFNFGKDFFGDKDVCSIVLEVPNSVFGTGKVGLWARSLTNMSGTWTQMDRGAVAAQSVFLTGEDREAYLAAEPADDDKFLATFAHSLEHLGEYPLADAQRVAKTLLPDVMPFDPTKAASYPHNGRSLTNDIMGIFLPIVTNKKIPGHGIPPHKDLLDDFPYVAPPHMAFSARPAAKG